MDPACSGPLAPVASSERVEILDILRGVAILGILLVNVQMFFAPIFLYVSGERFWHGTLDQAVEVLTVFFAQAKFYALFSFLFGLGFAVQSERAAARGATIGRFFARRLGSLAAIGLAHALLVWFGDILFLYALLGFLLIPFRGRATKTLAIWAGVLFCLPIVFQALRLGSVEIGRALAGPGEIERQLAESRQSMLELSERARVVYSSGTLGELFAMRAREWGVVVGFGLVGVGPQILGLFLVGLAFGQARFFHDLHEQLPRLRRAAPVLLACGVCGGILQVVGHLSADPLVPSVLGLLSSIAQTFLAPAMTAFYVCAICLVVQHGAWQRRLAPLAAVGRMALSNYLMHSVVFTLVAYSYGLGLYGRVAPSAALVLAVAVYAAQVPLSRAWIARYRFGPAEWLWRSLTYGSVQPMRRVAVPSASG